MLRLGRLPLAVGAALALAGCGVLLDFDPPDPDAGGPVDQGISIDAASDASVSSDAKPDAPVIDAGASDLGDAASSDFGVDAPSGPCVGQPNGTVCSPMGRPRLICVNSACVTSVCGDGFVDTTGGEECDWLSDTECNARTCRYDCRADSDCPDVSICLTAACVRHMCTYLPSHDGTTCGTAGGIEVCAAGLCVPPGCGDGMVEPGEDCDPLPPSVGCTGCHFDCTSDGACSDGDPCDGAEVCLGEFRGSVIVGRSCISSDPVLCAVIDACHLSTCVATSPTTGSCPGTLIDGDGDGFASTSLGPCGTDCNDADPNVHPGASEVCNGVDDDCDGIVDDHTVVTTWCLDGDGDGYGDPTMSVMSCAPPPGPYVRDCTDCWDTADPTRRAEAATVNPGQSGFFTMPYCPAATGVASCSYDYNCNGHETPQDTTIVNCGLLAPLICGSGAGWEGTVPACGGAGTFATCHGVMIGPIGLGCRAIPVMQPQACN